MLYNAILISVLSIIGSGLVFGQNTKSDLVLYGQDVRIEEKKEAGGFFLFVRKKENMQSVMLTESAERPSRDSNTYAYTTTKFNDINGNEKRVLNGRFIQPRSGFFIIDSTIEPDVIFGSAFVLFLPYTVAFGYANTRNGNIDIKEEGLYMSIRTFEQPYASYEGSYKDNAFYLEKIEKTSIEDIPPNSIVEKPPVSAPTIVPVSVAVSNAITPTKEIIPVAVAAPDIVKTPATASSLADIFDLDSVDDKYNPDTVVEFRKIAKRSNTQATFIENKNDIVDKIGAVLLTLPKNESSDIVILLDTTRSMWDDLAVLKSRLIPTISKIMQSRVYRIGLVLYRDEGEKYVTKRIEFNDQLESIQRSMNTLQASGGGDWPEAIYEALEEAVNQYSWIAENRIVFIVGDAPPHAEDETSVDVDRVYAAAAAKRILIYPMIVPTRN